MASHSSTVEHLQLTFRAAPALQKQRFLTRAWWLWCLIGVGLGLGGWWLSRVYLTRNLSEQLANAQTRDEAILALEGLVSLDDDHASLQIVRGLEHVDRQVARAAYRKLDSKITAWQLQDASIPPRRLLQLSQLLHDLPSSTTAESLILASGLALRVHSLCVDADDADLVKALELCEAVVQRAGAAQIGSSAGDAELESQQQRQRTVELERIQAKISAYPVPPPLPQATSAQFTDQLNHQQFTADGLPAADSQEPLSAADPLRSSGDAFYSSSGSPTARVQLVTSPRLGTATQSATPQSAGGQMTSHAIQAATSDAASFSLSDLDSPETSRGAALAPIDEAVRIELPYQATSRGNIDLNSIPTMHVEQLVRLLASSQPRVSQAASIALIEQGFDDNQLALASELATCSAARRLELTLAIANREDLGPQPWLLWMAEDGEPEVRRQAVSLLNSMVDDVVHRKLRELLTREQDEQVAMSMRQVLMTRPGVPLR